jgi:hypothetical protein
MLIRVMRTGNSYDYVKDFMLDGLIESEGILEFKRSTGWVTIGGRTDKKKQAGQSI